MLKPIIKTAVVDDDAKSRKILNYMLNKFPELDVIGEAEDISSAIKLIETTKPDLVFLDIHLKNESGFDLVKHFPLFPKIVFVSSYDNYALQAFEVDAVDYLTKPINKERLELTISKYIRNVDMQFRTHDGNMEENNFDRNEQIEHDNSKKLTNEDRIFISDTGDSCFIKISSIQVITAQKDYSDVHTFGGKNTLVLRTMKEWEEQLPENFVRIHRSIIINLDHVAELDRASNSAFIFRIEGISIPFRMSRRYASKIKERFR